MSTPRDPRPVDLLQALYEAGDRGLHLRQVRKLGGLAHVHDLRSAGHRVLGWSAADGIRFRFEYDSLDNRGAER